MVVDSLWSAPAVDCSISFASSRWSNQYFASSCSHVKPGISSHFVTTSISTPQSLYHTEIAEIAEFGLLSASPRRRRRLAESSLAEATPRGIREENFLSQRTLRSLCEKLSIPLHSALCV